MSTFQSSEFAQEVLRLTNEFRADHGLSPLTLNEKLTVTAQKYSETMAREDFFSHRGNDGSTPWDRAEAEGYIARAMAENIAAGQRTPEQVLQSWIGSTGHRENLLNPNYTELGVGYFELRNDTGQVNYHRYWTQMFGSGDLAVASRSNSKTDSISPVRTARTARTTESLEISSGNNGNNFAEEVLRLTNEFRAQHGRSPLRMNQELATTAQNYSRTMAEGDFFDHVGPNGSRPWDRARVEGYTARTLGENIAAGQRTPEQVVRGWINSPSHRENLLNASYTELGVGYFALENDTGQVNFGHYWTQLFGSGNLAQSTAEPVGDFYATGLEDLLIRVMGLTPTGNVQPNEQLSYRLDAAPGSVIDSRQVLTKDSTAQESVALIQVDSNPVWTDGNLWVA